MVAPDPGALVQLPAAFPCQHMTLLVPAGTAIRFARPTLHAGIFCHAPRQPQPSPLGNGPCTCWVQHTVISFSAEIASLRAVAFPGSPWQTGTFCESSDLASSEYTRSRANVL